MKTKRIDGVFYRQLEEHEVIRDGDKYLCRNCGQLHRSEASAYKPTAGDRHLNGEARGGRYYRECDPLIAAMLEAKEKHAKQTQMIRVRNRRKKE